MDSRDDLTTIKKLPSEKSKGLRATTNADEYIVASCAWGTATHRSTASGTACRSSQPKSDFIFYNPHVPLVAYLLQSIPNQLHDLSFASLPAMSHFHPPPIYTIESFAEDILRNEAPIMNIDA